MTTSAWDGRRRQARGAAFVAAALFVVGLSRFAVERLAGTAVLGDGHPWGAVVAAAPHLVLLIFVWPVLAAPRWAKGFGLFWFVLDLASDLLALAGAATATYLAVRFVGHLGAAVWIARTSWPARAALRVVGVLTAGYLAAYTLVSPWVPTIALAPSGPLLIAWCALVGRHLGRHRGQ